MISSYRSLATRNRDSRNVLPPVAELAELYSSGVVFRRGQLAMIAGRVGSQKSGFAMWLAARWGIKVLYFAADMGQHTSTIRDASICTGMTSEEVAAALKDPDLEGRVMEQVKERSRITFVNDASPSLQDVDGAVDAWVEMYDEFPPVIVLDNLMDIEPINESDYSSNKQILLQLKQLARSTGALVLVLHHDRDEGDPAFPAPVRALQSKVSQTPELILSVALDNRPNFRIFRISAVKNRSGPSAPMGDRWIELVPDPARTSFAARTFFTPYLVQGGVQ